MHVFVLLEFYDGFLLLKFFLSLIREFSIEDRLLAAYALVMTRKIFLLSFRLETYSFIRGYFFMLDFVLARCPKSIIMVLVIFCKSR
jgi:hypothetical protein